MFRELFVAVSFLSTQALKQVIKLQFILYKNYRTQNHFHLSKADYNSLWKIRLSVSGYTEEYHNTV